MNICVGIEHNVEGRTLAWALDYPGCFAYGSDEPEALIQLPRALLKYEIWIKDHTAKPWIDFSDLDIRVTERFERFWMGEDYKIKPEGIGYEINAWFHDDWRPLSRKEIEQALTIFNWQRDELMAGLTTLDQETLTCQRENERWNILGIAKHIANAERWYLSRLNLTELEKTDLEKTPEKRLAQTACLVNQIFPTFENQVVVKGLDGEFWSYRKILRRTLWHQRDHIEHIKKLAFD